MEEKQIKDTNQEKERGIYVERKGTVQIYRYPYKSMSYHLSNLSTATHNYYTSLASLGGAITTAYVLVTLKNSIGGFFYGGLLLDIVGTAFGIATLIRSKRDQQLIKEDIAEALSEIEPKVIPDEEAKKELVKRI